MAFDAHKNLAISTVVTAPTPGHLRHDRSTVTGE